MKPHQGREIVRSSTGEGGDLQWDVGANGDYSVTARKVGYFNATQMFSLSCSLDNCEVQYIKIFTGFIDMLVTLRSVKPLGNSF